MTRQLTTRQKAVLKVVSKKGTPLSVLDAVLEELDTLETKVIGLIAAIPKGEKGDPGESIVGPRGATGFDGFPGKTPIAGLDFPLPKDGRTPTTEEIAALIPAPIPGVPGIPGKDGSPDTPQQIREKLESLPEEEKLPIEAIKHLREELNALKKTTKEIGSRTTVVAAGRGAVKAYDLSNSLDGSTLTFALPGFWRVISVHLSSFPNILRENTDYTIDGTLMKITFIAAQVSPSTSLAVGQTCIVVYAEP